MLRQAVAYRDEVTVSSVLARATFFQSGEA